jgi:hypothetical protein
MFHVMEGQVERSFAGPQVSLDQDESRLQCPAPPQTLVSPAVPRYKRVHEDQTVNVSVEVLLLVGL